MTDQITIDREDLQIVLSYFGDENYDADEFESSLERLRAALRQPVAQEVDLTSYVQPVPNHCDRILWRNNYYHLPLPPAPEARPVQSDHICDKCGSTGWTANCDQCVPY